MQTKFLEAHEELNGYLIKHFNKQIIIFNNTNFDHLFSFLGIYVLLSSKESGATSRRIKPIKRQSTSKDVAGSVIIQTRCIIFKTIITLSLNSNNKIIKKKISKNI